MGVSAAVDVVGSALFDTAAADVGATAAADIGATAAADVGATAAADVAGATAADIGAGAVDAGFVGPSASLASAAGDAFLPGALAGDVAAPASSLGSLAGILGAAKTAAPIIGGLGQVLGGVGSLQAGRQIGQLAGQADPFGPYRSQYASQLSELMRDPSTVTKTPGYQFNLAQGLQAQQAQQAAQGRLVSGGALLQSQQFGQQLAGQSYQQQLQTLAGLSGAGYSPAAGAGAQANLLSSQLGGTLGGAQAISSGLGTSLPALYNLYQTYNQPSPTV